MRILIAGIGNIFHGDDAFGVEVANCLARRTLPAQAKVVDFGIRGFDLAYALLDGYDTAILVDATARGGRPGSLYILEIDGDANGGAEAESFDLVPHGMNPMRVLQMAKALGGCTARVLLVGCEPETLGPEDEGQMGLSATVAGVVERAADTVEALIGKLLDVGRTAPGAGAAA